MRKTVSTSSARTGKQRLLTSCAIAAGLAALAMGGPALAQVAGTGNVVSGTGTITPPGPSATTVTTTSPQAIVHWTPTDSAPTGGAIDFLPTGNTLNFVGTGNYTVLNRFVDAGGGSLSRQIALNGTVNSTIGSTTGPRGGNIWFYNAGGILIGSTGVINVGSLVLTANDIDVTGGLFGPGGEIRFRGDSGSTAAVTVNGAINAGFPGSPGSSYVALVAPRIVQNGTVTADGSVAYVAAEAVDIRINSGLFDIAVSVGADSDGGALIEHTAGAVTTGPEQAGGSPAHRIYMVAVPKNDAMGMLLSGSIGYQDAVVARTNSQGAVVLSAGYDIVNGAAAETPVNGAAAGIAIEDVTFRSHTIARASGNFAGDTLSGGILVEGNADFAGNAGTTLTIAPGSQFQADTLIIDSEAGATEIVAGGDLVTFGDLRVTGNTSVLSAAGGNITSGALFVTASSSQNADGSSQGGEARLEVTNGSVIDATSISVTANAEGGIDASSNGLDGTGGNASILVSGTGSSLTADDIAVTADGTGGTDLAAVGGSGTGGSATVRVENGGTLEANDSLVVSASGTGAFGTAQSGDGTGGTATIEVEDTGATVNSSTLDSIATTLSAGGTGAGSIVSALQTLNGGTGQGGDVTISITGDTSTSVDLGDTTLNAFGVGGHSNSDGMGAQGGAGFGGSVTVAIAGGASIEFPSLDVEARGESGFASFDSVTGRSGDSEGGEILFSATGGSTLRVDNGLTLNASAIAPLARNVGSSIGGDITLTANTGGAIEITGLLAGNAFARSGASSVERDSVGSSTGGTIRLDADGGSITALGLFFRADAATSHSGPATNAAVGGTISLTATGGGEIAATDGSGFFSTSAIGGYSDEGASATGGDIEVIADGGTISFANNAEFAADGFAGGATLLGTATPPVLRGGNILIRVGADSGSSMTIGNELFASSDGGSGVFGEGGLEPGGSGSGRGGEVTLAIEGGTFSASQVFLSAGGSGGIAEGGSEGNAGIGGTATFRQSGGDAFINDLSVVADGEGGAALGNAPAGRGEGGVATINFNGGTYRGETIVAYAEGSGGAGQAGYSDGDPANDIAATAGGEGRGGTATINLDGTTDVGATEIIASAMGFGGAGGDYLLFGGSAGGTGSGGDSFGGTAEINLIAGTLNTDEMIADASGIGGAGGEVILFTTPTPGGAGAGGSGGLGHGGIATIRFATLDAEANDTIAVRARGEGGAGSNNSTGGDGGGGQGGTAAVVIDNIPAGTLDLMVVDAGATGGDGGNGQNGAGGNGGFGSGGTASVEVLGEDGRAFIAAGNFITTGTGGNGGDAFVDFMSAVAGPAGGNGGDGNGGTLNILASDGAVVALAGSLSSNGVGGDGGRGADNFGSVTLPGPDGELGTMDDEVVNFTGGDGGIAGAGIGGTVQLTAIGATIDSDGAPVFLSATGQSGDGGDGGDGTGGSGGCCSGFVDQGGRVIIQALNSASETGRISLGDTSIDTDGFIAGRIELIAEGTITMTSLTAQAAGFADPTNNDTDVAPRGIFMSVLDGGLIQTDGAMALTTGSSVGVYAQGSGQLNVGGDLTVAVEDQVDIRHDFRDGDAPTIQTGGSASFTAVNSIRSAEGGLVSTGDSLSMVVNGIDGAIDVDSLDAQTSTFLIAQAGRINVYGTSTSGDDLFANAANEVAVNDASAGDDISLIGGTVVAGSLITDGSGFDSELDGSNIFIRSTAATTVEHAEADNDFTAIVGSFATGLDSIITGGDIDIDSVGDVDLGNSDAGGSVTVSGTSILFNDLFAGTSIDLTATTGGVTGTGIVAAGQNLNIDAAGDVDVAELDAGIDLILVAGGDIATGAATAGGNLLFTADGSIGTGALTAGFFGRLEGGGAIDVGGDVNANVGFAALGSEVSVGNITAPNGSVGLFASAGDITATGTIDTDGGFDAIATGAVSLTGDVRAGNGAIIEGASIELGSLSGSFVQLTSTSGGITSTGEIESFRDISITTADGGDFNRLVAGDDIFLQGSGDVTIAFMNASGENPGGEEIGSNVEAVLAGHLHVEHGEAADDFTANVASFSTGLNSIITGGNIDITADGPADLGNSTAGGFIDVDAQSIAFVTLDAGDYVDLHATGSAPGEGIAGTAILAGTDVLLDGSSIAVDSIAAGGSLSAVGTGGPVAIGQASIAGNIGVFAAGDLTGIYNAGGDIALSSAADIIVTANAAGGAPDPSNGDVNTAGNVFTDAAGDVVLTDSSAAGMFGVNAGGSATLTHVTAGEDLLVLAGTTADLAHITVGDDLDVRAADAVTVTDASATGAGPDGFLLNYSSSGGFTIGQGEGASSIDGADIDLRSTGSSVTATDLSAGDDIFIDAATTLAVTGATTLGLGQTGGASGIFTQSGDATLSGLDAFDDVDVQSSGVVDVTGAIRSGRDTSITADSVTMATLVDPNNTVLDTINAGRNLTVVTSDAIDASVLRAGGDLSLTAGTTVDVQQAVSGAGGTLTLDGADGVIGGLIVSGGPTTLTSAGGNVEIGSFNSAGPVTASADSILIASGGGSLVFSQLETDVGDASVTTSGNLSVTSGQVAGTATLRSGFNLDITQLAATDIELESSNTMTLGSVTADETLFGEASGMLTVNGGVTGRQMSLGSHDIAIGANGRLGTGGTTEILDVRNTSDETTFVGGTGTRSSYHLDADEMTRLFGNDITIFAPRINSNQGGFVALAPGALPVPIASVGSSDPPDVVIDDFTVTAGGSTSNIGASGSLTIATPGKARVIGDAALTGMSDSNSFSIFADDALEVILGEGTIRLTGSGSAPGGMLNLVSDDVIVATASAISDVGSATGIGAINDRLAQNDGIVLDDGALFAGGIDVSVTGGFYVQNSGTGTAFDERRGLTFGPLGLNVNVEDANSRIVINGVHLGSSGQVTGLDVIPLMSIDGFVLGSGPLSGSGLAFDSGSTVNGCVIANPASCVVLIDDHHHSSSFPVQDVIEREEEGEGEDADGLGLPIPLITMRDLDPLTGEPLLDDPVTGAGNDDLWTPPVD